MISAIWGDIIALFKPALFNIYFIAVALPIAFPFAILLALGKESTNRLIKGFCEGYIFVLRGSPIFVQFFMVYSLFLAFNISHFKPWGIDHWAMHPLFIGPLVLILNTSAYTAQIFHGAYRAIPPGEVEAAKAMGMSRWQVFRTATWPNMLRLAWPAYTNEAVFLFQATVFVYLTLPIINDQQDLMAKAKVLFETDYNIYLHFFVAALYFYVITQCIVRLCGKVNDRLNRHQRKEQPVAKSQSFKIRLGTR